MRRAKACGELARAAGYLTNLADIEGILGNYHEAMEHYEEALALHRTLSQPFGMVSALNNLGYLHQQLGSPESAYPLLQEGLELARSINFHYAIPSLLGNLAAVFYRFGDYAKAQALGEEALELMRDEEDPSHKAPILNTLGEVATALDDFPKARGYFLESLAISRSVKEWPNALETLISLAELRIRQGNDEQACELLGFAVHHPALRRYSLDLAQKLLQGLRERLAPEVWQAALERGKAAAPDELIGKVLADADA